MKKNLILMGVSMLYTLSSLSQNSNPSYTIPAYSKEIYFIKKDSSITLSRLEKGS